LSDSNYRGEKINKCKKCRYFKNCSGFPSGYLRVYGDKELCPIPDLPKEVMIEVEPRCNFNCRFCFNKISFAEHSREIKSLGTAYLKKVIDGLVLSKIKTVRFTGGEPLLRKDIFELMKYAKKSGLEVRLNTNGFLINQSALKKLKGLVDNVLIPIESNNKKTEEKITGCPGSLDKKIRAIESFSSIRVPMVRVGTVATEQNIKNFKGLAKLVFNLPIDEWEFYRPAAISVKVGQIKNQSAEKLVENILKAREKTSKKIMIANAWPFCSIKNPNKFNAVSSGALFDEGHSRLVIDPRGFVKPHYFIDVKIGDPLDILDAWKHPFMKKIRNLDYLSKQCRKCCFRYKCCGGSRYHAKLAHNDWWAQDPLVGK